jgi:hypothetical protein
MEFLATIAQHSLLSPASCLLLRRSNDLICTGLWSLADSPEKLATTALVRNSKARPRAPCRLLAGRFFLIPWWRKQA